VSDLANSQSQNLVSLLKELLDRKSPDGRAEIDGSNILWHSTGPDGLCYVEVLNKAGDIYSDTTCKSYDFHLALGASNSLGELLTQMRSPNQTVHPRNNTLISSLKSNFISIAYRSTHPNLLVDTTVHARSVEHIAFTNDGGWLVCYSDGRVRVSTNGTFPESFHTEMSSEIKTRGFSGLQNSSLQYAWFGADDTMILQFRNGETKMRGFSSHHPLVSKIEEYSGKGLFLTRATSLCRWNSNYYFAEFAPVGPEATREYGFNVRFYHWNILPNGELSDILVQEIVNEDGVPVSSTAIKLGRFPPTGDLKQTAAPPTPKPAARPMEAPPKMLPKRVQEKKEDILTVRVSEVLPRASMQSGRKENNPFAKKAQPPSDTLSVERKSFFTSVFHMAEPYERAGYITGDKAVEILRIYSEGLADDELEEIWNKCDDNEDGQLDLHEFLNVMKLIQKAAAGKKSATPKPNTNPFARKTQPDVEKGYISPPPPPYTPSTSLQNTEPTTSRTITETLICSLCCKNIIDKTFSCSVCENGEFDMCAQCQKSGRRCPGRHTLECVGITTPRELGLELDKIDLNGANPTSNNPNGARSESDRQLKDALLSAIVTEKPNVKWDDIAGKHHQ
jgi:hypothetical protein